MPGSDRESATQLLARIGAGDESPAALLPVVYAELRAIADQLMRRERDDHTLQPTALVHEAFVRLIEGEATLGRGRRDFLAVAATAMRNLLVDHARRRGADKRGGSQRRITLDGLLAESDAESDVELLDLHEALQRLEQLDQRQARIVELCFFAGMTGHEIAEHLGVHRNTVVRELRMARAWLQREMGRA